MLTPVLSPNDWWCSGNPLFLEPYWRRHAAASAVVVSGWHRMSYRATDGMFQSVDLERHIRRLHRAVGNAIADGKRIVFAAGSMQLINALVYALSPDDANAASSSPPARVVATAPYYPVSCYLLFQVSMPLFTVSFKV